MLHYYGMKEKDQELWEIQTWMKLIHQLYLVKYLFIQFLRLQLYLNQKIL